ncbi:hypothetical protein BEP19_03305 [Ammoniphilus oxalaticus]|uniref:Uncharacterized protein n=1 Tax=Ammoniphilus oxalaticus TaxID=66863 RepID=A0A419SNU2_9BACL|nr:hypothetical protein BEP19_03305 [Ammoniphilus oxalaticus]
MVHMLLNMELKELWAVFLLLAPAMGHLIDQIISTPSIAFGFLTTAFALHIVYGSIKMYSMAANLCAVKKTEIKRKSHLPTSKKIHTLHLGITFREGI